MKGKSSSNCIVCEVPLLFEITAWRHSNIPEPSFFYPLNKSFKQVKLPNPGSGGFPDTILRGTVHKANIRDSQYIDT